MAASKNPLVRLGHILDEIDALEEALNGIDYPSFSENYVLRRTAERAILIISEAVKALSPEFTDRYSGIDWQRVRDVGNFLRHQYFDADDRLVWGIVTERLPPLKTVVEQMIADVSKIQN